MHLTHLTIDQFRSYAHLDVDFDAGLTLIVGENGAGKSNLLEAIYALATTRSPRSSTEGELLAWDAPEPAVARIAGTAARGDGEVSVELVLVARTDAQGAVLPSKSGAPLTSKRLRVNGVPRRATDVMGQIGAVLFTTHDIEVITGSPGTRRRYLDLTIAQSDRQYARWFSQYDKAVTQRNALLKRIGKGEASAEELQPWDESVAQGGGAIMAARAAAIRELQTLAAHHHLAVAASDHEYADTLELGYLPALGDAALPEVADPSAIEARIRAGFTALRPREIGAGTTLVGPHRDDLSIMLQGRSASAYASRAQQRSVALALRLAEADLLRQRSGESPVLLLDDVFSELDPQRRTATALALRDAEQVILTTADPESVPAELPAAAAAFRVAAGSLERI